MYTFSNRLKIGSFILMAVGLLMVGYGFMNSHKSLDDVKELLAAEASAHGGGHGEEASHDKGTAHGDEHAKPAHAESHDTTAAHGKADVHHGDAHAEHTMHQIHNRPYAALYVAAFFFFMIALGSLAFYAVQWAAQAGWSPLLFRVMEAITYYVLPGAVIVLLIAVVGDSHLFIWLKEGTTTEGHENYDALVAGKSGWLNKTGFIVR